MKLKDFLKEFEGCDPESDMLFWMGDGCCGDHFSLDEPSMDYWPNNSPTNTLSTSYVLIDFPALDFLSSCRRSSAAQQAGKPYIPKAPETDDGERHRSGGND